LRGQKRVIPTPCNPTQLRPFGLDHCLVGVMINLALDVFQQPWLLSFAL
jgi:hypothetical protein